MAKERINNETDWTAVSARAQAYLCLYHAGMLDKDKTDQARFLMNNLGLSRPDAAALLGSSDDSLRIMLGRSAKGGAKATAKVAREEPA